MWGLTGALFVAAVLLVVAFTDGPQPDGAWAGATPACNSAATDGNATIYPSPLWGGAGTSGVVELYGANGFEGERVVEVIWGGASPDQGTLIGVGTIPGFGTSSTDTTFVVPNNPPGAYAVWVCWDNGGGDSYSYELFEFTILGAAECGTYGGLTQVEPEDFIAIPNEPFAGENVYVELYNPPPGTSQNVGRVEFLLDPDFPGDTGTHLGMGWSYYIPLDGGAYSSTISSNGDMPGNVAPGPHTLVLCWYNNPSETWFYSTIQINVLPEGAPRPDCDGLYNQDQSAQAAVAPPSGIPLDLLDIDWTSDVTPYLPAGPEEWEVEVLWDWTDKSIDPVSAQLIGSGTYYTAVSGVGNYGEASGIVPVGAEPGNHTITLCILSYWTEGFYYVDIPFDVAGASTGTPSPSPSPTASLTPTAALTPTPTTTPDCRRFVIAGTTPDSCETRETVTPSPTVQAATETPVPTELPTDAPTAPPTEPPDVGTPAPPGDTPAPTPTASPTLIPPETQTPFVTASPTLAVTPTATPTALPTATSTPAVTLTATVTPAASQSPTPTSISVAATPRPSVFGNPNAGGTPTPTPTATLPRTPSPTPTVLAEQDPPDDNTDDPGSVVTDESGGNYRPEVIRSVFTPADISGDIGIIGTNLVLAGFTLMLMLLTAEIFNQTVEDNEQWLKDGLARMMGPLRGVFGVFADAGRALTDGRGIAGLFAPVFLLALAALLYGLEEPGAGLNNRTLVLFLSFLGAFAILTYLYDGGQLLVTNRYRVPAAIRLFPAGIIVALFCIGMTKLLGFQPGIIYGFIAAHTLMGAHSLSDEQEGKQIFFPAVALLTVCAAAWLLVDPARNLAEDNNSFWAAVPEGVAVGIFVGGLEGMFFQMIPIKWMDGEKLMKWSKLAWFSVTGVTAFLFWHVLLNTERESFGTLSETTPAIALLLMGICFATTVGFYLFCRIRNARQPLGA